MQYLYINKLKIISFFLIGIPFFLTTGPLLPDLIVVITSIIFLFNYKKDLKEISKKNYILLIFWVFLVFSSLASENILYSLKSSFFYIRFYIFSFFIFYLLKKKIINFKSILNILLVILIFLICDSHFQYIFGWNIFGFVPESKLRISSIFGSELIMGSFILRIFPIMIICSLLLKKKKILYLLPLIYSSIILSGERTSILMSIFFLIIFLIIKLELKQKIIIFSSILLVFFVHFNFNKNFNYNFTERMKEEIIFDLNKNLLISYLNKKKNEQNLPFTIFTENHTLIFNTAFSMFLEKKIIGHGPNTFRKKCDRFDDSLCSTHPHNFIFQLLAETGIIGLFFYLSLILLLIINLFKCIFYKVSNSNIKIILISSLLINFFPLSPSGNFFNNFLNISMYYPLGFYLYFFDINKNYN